MANLPVDPKSILYYSHVRSPIWTSIEEFALAQVGPAREQVEEDGSYKWAAWPEEALSYNGHRSSVEETLKRK